MKRQRSLVLSVAVFSTATFWTAFASTGSSTGSSTARSTLLANTASSPPPPPPPPPPSSWSKGRSSSLDGALETPPVETRSTLTSKAPPPPPPHIPPPPPPLRNRGDAHADQSTRNIQQEHQQQHAVAETSVPPPPSLQTGNKEGSTNSNSRQAFPGIPPPPPRSPVLTRQTATSSNSSNSNSSSSSNNRKQEQGAVSNQQEQHYGIAENPALTRTFTETNPLVTDSTVTARKEIVAQRLPPPPPQQKRPVTTRTLQQQSTMAPVEAASLSNHRNNYDSLPPPPSRPNYRVQSLQNQQQQQRQQPASQQRQQYPDYSPPPKPQQVQQQQLIRSQQAPLQQQQQQTSLPGGRLLPARQQQRPRVNPSQLMQDYSRRHPAGPPPPAWKRIWRKVERSLDGLADLESVVTGAVSDRAQHLYSATVSTVKIPTFNLPSVGGGAEKKGAAQPKPAQSSPRPVPMSFGKPGSGSGPVTVESFVMRKGVVAEKNAGPGGGNTQNRKDSENEPSTKTPSVPSNPYEHLLQKSFFHQAQPTKGTKASTPYQKIGLNELMTGKTTRMIRANGGASQPHNYGPRESSVAPVKVAGMTQGRGAPGPLQHSSQTAPRPPPSGARGPLPKSDARGSPPRSSRPYLDDDDDEGQSWMAKLGRVLPPIPRMPSLKFRFGGRGDSFRDFSSTVDAWQADEDTAERRSILNLFRRKRPESYDQAPEVGRTKSVKNNAGELTPPLANLMDRCNYGKTLSLLTAADQSKCVTLGRFRAMMDVFCLIFILVGARQLMDLGAIHLPHSIAEIFTLTTPSILSALAPAMDTWAPYAFAGAFLAAQTNSLFFNLSVDPLIRNVGVAVREEAEYGSLFLRLLAATSSSDRVPEQMETAAREQILSNVGITRMKSFVAFFLASIVLMTTSFIQPLLAVMVRAPFGIVGLEQWRSWPLQWRELAAGLKSVLLPVYRTMYDMIGTEMNALRENPFGIAYEASVFCALIAAAFLPILVSRRSVQSVRNNESENESLDPTSAELSQHVANLGISGASRLSLLSDDNGVERVLERWRMILPESSEQLSVVSTSSLLRLVCYGLVSGAILAAPLLVHGYVGISSFGSLTSPLVSWDSLFNLAVVLFFTHRLVWKAIEAVVLLHDSRSAITGFLGSLAVAVKERKQMLQSRPVNLQLQAAISPAAGIVVKDLWAAHTTKRAWAIRGANLACRNGETLVILGDDGSG